MVVDLSRLSFLDSTGLGALVAARNQAQQAGAGSGSSAAQIAMLKLFRITGLDAVFEIYPTLAEANPAGCGPGKAPASAGPTAVCGGRRTRRCNGRDNRTIGV